MEMSVDQPQKVEKKKEFPSLKTTRAFALFFKGKKRKKQIKTCQN
jgi:hypothetical protein